MEKKITYVTGNWAKIESANPLMSSPLLQGVLQNIEEENRRTQEDDSDGDVIIDDVTGSE